MKTAVMVDDSEIDQFMGRALLEKLGYSVTSANDGHQALQLIQENPPNLVLCDISMPNMSGIELLQATRNISPPPLFVMASGQTEIRDAVAAMQQGAYGYLTKPLTEEALRAALAEAQMRFDADQAQSSRLETLAKYDGLTGLFNKSELARFLHMLTRSTRRRDHPSVLALANVDGLRLINNTYGHKEGDRVLRHVAGLLRQSIRTTDYIARFGGDVFALVLVGIEPEETLAKLQNILNRIESDKVLLGGKPHGVTITIGAAICMEKMEECDLLTNAEFSLDAAQHKGRNRFHLFAKADEAEKLANRKALGNLEILRDAMEHGRFEMHYQPVVDLRTNTVSHFEALLRLRDVNGVSIPPYDMVRTAETFGLIGKLDRLVVQTCLTEITADSKNTTHVAINLSAKSVDDPEFLPFIEAEFAAHNVDPARIMFEITETAVFDNLAQVQHFIRRVKSVGCRFALDDFGVGFSSFYFIKELDIDYLKIDGSFIRNIVEQGNDQVFVKAMVEISKVFGMHVIAEWVENEATAQLLKPMGVHYGQGSFHGEPAPFWLACAPPAPRVEGKDGG